MPKRLHRLTGGLALAIVLGFWLSTVFSELLAGPESIAFVKRAILWAMPVLIACLMLTGASGFRQAFAGPLAKAKLGRMRIIAANGLLVLLPSAFLLDGLAAQGRFDGLFYALQGLELVVGAVNLTLMALNARDGFRLSGRFGAYIRP